MATISRDQFDETNAVQKKVFQKGTHVLDSDLNEQIDVALDNRQRTLSCLLSHEDARFDNGFSVAEHANDLTVTIKAGQAAFHLDSERAVLLHHPEDTTITGFASWVSGGVERTDLIYIDIEELEYGPADDADIVNPDVGEETCRDVRLKYSFGIVSGGTTLPDAPAGNVYRAIATITKSSASDTIRDSEIAVALPLGQNSGLATMEIPLWNRESVHPMGGNSNAYDLDRPEMQRWAYSSGEQATCTPYKIPYAYNAAHKYLALRCEAWCEPANTEPYIKIETTTESGPAVWLGDYTSPQAVVAFMLLPTTGMIEGSIYTIQITLTANSDGGNARTYIQKPVIVAGLGNWGA